MWRDELQAWLIARDSPDIFSLFKELPYEGHPPLWFLVLRPAARLSGNPIWMQVIHVGIATATVALVLWRAPLSRIEQVFFPFGYYVFFEYAVKSRAYALGFLLLAVFCSLWSRRRSHPVLMAVIIALFANVHVHFAITSVGAVAALAYDRFINARLADRTTIAPWRSYIVAGFVVIAGWTIAVLTAWPSADTGSVAGWFLQLDFNRLTRTYLALSAVVGGAEPSIAAATFSLFAIVLFCVLARKDLPAIIFLIVSVVILLTFFYVKYAATAWHRGVIFVDFFAAIWIDRIFAVEVNEVRPRLLRSFPLGLVLAVQAWLGIMMAQTDIREPLSRAEDVARFIKSNGWDKDPVLGSKDSVMAPIVGYLQIERAYYANGRRWGSFTVWDRKRLLEIDLDGFLADAASFGPVSTLVVSCGKPAAGCATNADPALLRKYGFAEVGIFDGARVADENYLVYRRSSATPKRAN